MFWSKLFIPTLRENPVEAEIPSHQLLLRAGYIRPAAAGIFTYLFLAQRSLRKIQQIIRSEMDAMGAQEFLLPVLHPAELWRESGRRDLGYDHLFRLKDRFGHDFCLAVTHEEITTATARGELRSYKQLPQIWYQIQTKFRDEPGTKSGLLRAREFTAKDSCSFDIDAEGLDIAYGKHDEAYRRIFAHCGLKVLAVEAPAASTEFMVLSDAGEDLITNCPGCGYAANLETAVSYPAGLAIEDPGISGGPEEFYTPGRKTIQDVCDFTGMPASSQIKSLVLAGEGKLILALLRGDHHLSETKFLAASGEAAFQPAQAAAIGAQFGAEPGSLGPVGITGIRIIADRALQGRRNMMAGANRNDYHLRGVTPGRDFEAEYADLRQVCEGDRCTSCGGGLLVKKALKAGHVSKPGARYSEAMGLRVLSANGTEVAPLMGSYGIGIERILAAAVEQNHDDGGMFLPVSIAPFAVIVTPVNNSDTALRDAARRIHDDCLANGLDVLYDDRDERPGVKFKDADLIGVPYRITIGKKLSQGVVELMDRKSRTARDVNAGDVVAELKAQVQE